jgi:hypothetical protein
LVANQYQSLNITDSCLDWRYTDEQLSSVWALPMSQISVSPDDLPPVELTKHDRELHHQLEETVCKYFYEACDGVTQGLLMTCGWRIVIQSHALILAVTCPDQPIQSRVLNNLEPLSIALSAFSPTAKIRIYSEFSRAEPLEIRIDEISV